MSGWKLHWRERPHGPTATIDGSRLQPESLGALSSTELGALRINVGRIEMRLGELFDIEALADVTGAPRLVVEGSPRFERLGAGMSGGRLEVLGHGGFALGARMAGGDILVAGDVGHLAGGGMRGGVMRITGNAGEAPGGPVDGETLGQRGGEVLVDGDAGRDAGLGLRRGLLAIGGSAGEHVGRQQRAGTILVAQGELASPGMMMRRGTILALGGKPRLASGFARDGLVFPTWLRLLQARLDVLGFTRAQRLQASLAAGTPWESHSGDALGLGRGEILYPAE